MGDGDMKAAKGFFRNAHIKNYFKEQIHERWISNYFK